jgi:integrase
MIFEEDLESHEIKILEAEIDTIKKETENIKAVMLSTQKAKQWKAEAYKKLYAKMSEHIGLEVNENNFRNIDFPEDVYSDIVDEFFGNKDNLIREKHFSLPYSLLKIKPELREYIPAQNPKSGLDLLNDRSTSRAYEIVREDTSENTHRAHMGDLVYMVAWLEAVNFSFKEPISEKEVLSFIIQHAEGLDSEIDQRLVKQRYKNKLGPHKLSTIKRRIGSLSVCLELNNFPNPCRSEEVKRVLNKLTKKYGGSKPAGRAITRDILDDILETCGDKLIDVRDKALLLFAWGSGGRRREEVATADKKDLIKNADGDYVYFMQKSKTDQTGKGNSVVAKGRVAKALSDWLMLSGIFEGKIFRSISKGGKVGSAISPIDVHRIVRRRLKAAGYDETQFGAHSLRSGFVTEAGRKGKNIGDVMQMTTHKSVQTVMKYYQAGNIVNNSAANLAD